MKQNPCGVDQIPKGASFSANIQAATGVRYRALTWLTAAAALAYLCRHAIGVAESTIRLELGLTLEQSGLFMGAFFWTYAIFQVPTGWLTERLGTRVSLSLFAMGWSAAMVGVAAAHELRLLIVAQLTMGIAQAGLMPAACSSIGNWMPFAQRSLACGIVGAGLQFGAMAAGWLTAALLDPFGWRLAFSMFALPGFLWTAGFFACFRNDPAEVLPPDSSELRLIRSDRYGTATTVNSHRSASLRSLAIALSPAVLWLCGQQICRSAGYMFFASWFPTFLQRTHGITIAESGYVQGLIFGATLLGCVVGGAITDVIWRRTQNLWLSRSGVGSLSLAVCSLTVLGAWGASSSMVAVGLLILGAFSAACAGPCAFAAVIDISGRHVPQVAGLMNMSGNLAAAACPVLVGRLFALSANWNTVLLYFAGVFFIGAFCWLWVNPTSDRTA